MPRPTFLTFKILFLVAVSGALAGCLKDNRVIYSSPISSMPLPTYTETKPQELIDWLKIKDSDDPSQFFEYVKTYPKGTFTATARGRADGGKADHTNFKFDGFWEPTYTYYGPSTKDCFILTAFPFIIKRNQLVGTFEHPAQEIFFQGVVTDQGDVDIIIGSGNLFIVGREKLLGNSGLGELEMDYSGAPIVVT